MSKAIVILSFCLFSCSGAKSPAEAEEASTSGGEGSEVVCEPGMDQSCNDDPAISSLHGRCLPNGTCECANGIEKNPETGRCL